MKKVGAMMLSLVLALGLMAGCGQKDSGSGSGAKTVESLKIAFSPYADADQITTATEPLEALLKAKLLEKGYDVQNIDMTVGTSYTAVGEALSAGSADIGFISGGNYVLFSDDCDVLLTALRYGINKDSENAADWNDGKLEENTQDMTTYYRSIILAGPSAKGQALLAKVNSGEELTWDDLNGATWSVLAPTSASGYIYPSLWLQEHFLAILPRVWGLSGCTVSLPILCRPRELAVAMCLTLRPLRLLTSLIFRFAMSQPLLNPESLRRSCLCKQRPAGRCAETSDLPSSQRRRLPGCSNAGTWYGCP